MSSATMAPTDELITLATRRVACQAYKRPDGTMPINVIQEIASLERRITELLEATPRQEVYAALAELVGPEGVVVPNGSVSVVDFIQSRLLDLPR